MRESLDRFAELAVEVGANVQPGQVVQVTAEVEVWGVDADRCEHLLLRSGHWAGAEPAKSGGADLLAVHDVAIWRR